MQAPSPWLGARARRNAEERKGIETCRMTVGSSPWGGFMLFKRGTLLPGPEKGGPTLRPNHGVLTRPECCCLRSDSETGSGCSRSKLTCCHQTGRADQPGFERDILTSVGPASPASDARASDRQPGTPSWTESRNRSSEALTASKKPRRDGAAGESIGRRRHTFARSCGRNVSDTLR
jgi:hypothetical protein